jgi:hypothetical protein
VSDQNKSDQNRKATRKSDQQNEKRPEKRPAKVLLRLMSCYPQGTRTQYQQRKTCFYSAKDVIATNPSSTPRHRHTGGGQLVPKGIQRKLYNVGSEQYQSYINHDYRAYYSKARVSRVIYNCMFDFREGGCKGSALTCSAHA